MLIERAQELQSGTMGVLRIGATPPMIEALMAHFLVDWRARHSGIELHLVEDAGASLADRLDRGDVHLAYAPTDEPRFEYRLLYPIHVVAAVTVKHALARFRSLELARLDGLPLIALRRGFGSRDWFDEACQRAGLHPKFVLESASHNAILALAAAGYGIGILRSAIVQLPEGGSARFGASVSWRISLRLGGRTPG